MHGAGNDYIYVDTTQYPISHPEELARAWSAPHTGIGSDGLVLIGSSDKADFSMRIFNADGSEALKDVIRSVRNSRAEVNVAPSKPITILI